MFINKNDLEYDFQGIRTTIYILKFLINLILKKYQHYYYQDKKKLIMMLRKGNLYSHFDCSVFLELIRKY